MKNIINLITKFLDFCNLFLVASIALIIGLQIFCRAVLNSPLPWPEEISKILVMFIVFLGVGLLEKNNSHISVQYIYTRVSSKTAKYLMSISKILSLFIATFILLGEIEMFPHIVDLRLRSSHIPYSFIHSIITLGIILWIICSIYTFIRTFSGISASSKGNTN